MQFCFQSVYVKKKEKKMSLSCDHKLCVCVCGHRPTSPPVLGRDLRAVTASLWDLGLLKVRCGVFGMVENKMNLTRRRLVKVFLCSGAWQTYRCTQP